MSVALGARATAKSTSFALRAPRAQAIWLCLFSGRKERRIAMQRQGDIWRCRLGGDLAGTLYGFRADGEWAPERGLWFDPAKLLVDPYAIELDRRFTYDPALSVFGVDTAGLAPKAVVQPRLPKPRKRKPVFAEGGLIYELNVRGFTKQHGKIPRKLRGTVAALAHPAVIKPSQTPACERGRTDAGGGLDRRTPFAAAWPCQRMGI